MTEKNEPQGCRNAAITTSFLLASALVSMVGGLLLVNSDSCEGICQTLGLTLLYAGGPLSALLGVLFGGVWVAWPLDVTLWVVAGFASARWAERRSRGVLGVVLILLVLALIYGLVLSQFVEIAV
ncbi:MAG: hypothetical protein ACC658_11360 [Acidimicrobiia bacterium]